MAVADVYDALIETRCYRKAMPIEEARGIILKGRGSHFDPLLVDLFGENEAAFREVAEQYYSEKQEKEAKGLA
jgi:putative two-component system response regulator